MNTKKNLKIKLLTAQKKSLNLMHAYAPKISGVKTANFKHNYRVIFNLYLLMIPMKI